jgi:hypothetical protein
MARMCWIFFAENIARSGRVNTFGAKLPHYRIAWNIGVRTDLHGAERPSS